MTSNGKNTLFAGAGPGEGANAGRYRGGLYRLRPGATEWELVAGGLPQSVEVRCIAQHPTDPKTIFVGTQDGPYRSTDGGETWVKPNFPDKGAIIWTVAVHPTRPNIVYCGAAPVAVYRSIDGGETWTDVSAHLFKLADQPHLHSNVGGRNCGHCEGMLDTHALAISRAAPDTAFLALRMGIFRTDDGGATWTDTEVRRFAPLTYCRDIIVSPHDPKVFYAALSQAAFSTAGSLYRSDDVAQTWTRIDHGVSADSTVMALAAHPTDPASLYSVTRMGQVIGTQDNGASWQDHPLPKDVHDVYAVACH